MSIYGMQEPAVRDADAHMQRSERLEAARAAYCNEREREIRADLARPLQACIDAVFCFDKRPPIGAELVAWVIQTSADPERTLAEAIWSDLARARLVAKYAAERAEFDAIAMLERGAL